MLIRGEISDRRYTQTSDTTALRGLATVTVEVTVLSRYAKEALDLLVNTAWDFGTKTVDRDKGDGGSG